MSDASAAKEVITPPVGDGPLARRLRHLRDAVAPFLKAERPLPAAVADRLIDEGITLPEWCLLYGVSPEPLGTLHEAWACWCEFNGEAKRAKLLRGIRVVPCYVMGGKNNGNRGYARNDETVEEQLANVRRARRVAALELFGKVKVGPGVKVKKLLARQVQVEPGWYSDLSVQQVSIEQVFTAFIEVN